MYFRTSELNLEYFLNKIYVFFIFSKWKLKFIENSYLDQPLMIAMNKWVLRSDEQDKTKTQEIQINYKHKKF